MLLPNKNVDYFLITPENPVVFKIFDYFVTHVWCHSNLWPLSNGLLTIVRNIIFEAQHPRGWKVQNQHLCDKNKWLSHFRTFSFLLFLSLKVLKILCRGTNLFPNRAILPERTQKRLNQQKIRIGVQVLVVALTCCSVLSTCTLANIGDSASLCGTGRRAEERSGYSVELRLVFEAPATLVRQK